jgi:PAS domain S-box-containing protein
MSLYACPFAAPAQPVRMALLSLHDVTGLRQAEESNSRLAAIVEWSDDAIVTEDIDGIITSWNGGAQRMFGYAPDEIIGKPITLLIPENRLNDERNSLARVKRGERIEPYDTVRQRKDGSLTEISVTISPLRDAAGITIGASRIARDITDRKQAEETLRLLAHEVDHRSKNLLSLVQATVHFSKADTAEEIKMAIEGRIHALSNVHNLLAQSRWTGADLRHLVTDELRPYCSEGASATEIVGPDISLKPQIAQLIAMVLHELTTNAVKYGALSVSQGRVCIEWSLATSGRLALRWIETGGPPVRQPQRHGFGTRVLDRAIRAQLKGDIRFDWRTEGLACEIELPVE